MPVTERLYMDRPWEELSGWEQELLDFRRAQQEREEEEYWRELGEYQDWKEAERRRYAENQ